MNHEEIRYINDFNTTIAVEYGEGEDGHRAPQIRITVAGFQPGEDDGVRDAYLSPDDLNRIRTMLDMLNQL